MTDMHRVMLGPRRLALYLLYWEMSNNKFGNSQTAGKQNVLFINLVVKIPRTQFGFDAFIFF